MNRPAGLLACLVVLLTPIGCGQAQAPLDEAIDTWSHRAIEYASKVTDPQEWSTTVPAALAVMHAQQGRGRLALASAAEIQDVKERRELELVFGVLLNEAEIVEFVEGLPDQATKDRSLKLMAMAQALERDPSVGERLVGHISPAERTEGWLWIASAYRARKDYQAALTTLAKAAPVSQQDRDRITTLRNDLEKRLRAASEPPAAKPQRDLTAELRAAKKKTEDAEDAHAKANAWRKVGEIQRELNQPIESRQSLQQAEAAVDKIAEFSFRTMLLALLADDYRKLGDNSEVGRVALKGLIDPEPAQDDKAQANADIMASLHSYMDGTVTQPSLMKLLVESGQLDKGIEMAHSNNQWQVVGAAAASSDELLAQLDARLTGIASNTAKVLLCTGVVSGLVDRKKKQATPPAGKPQ